MTTFSDQLYQYGGVPVGTPMVHTGNTYFVKPYSGSDEASGKTPAKALKTLAEALDRCTADHGDCVYMIAESNTAANTTDYQSTALNWNKDGVHLIGLGTDPLIGTRARIAQTSTVIDIETLVTFSADNCTIANIAIYHGVDGSTATAPVAVSVTGTRNHFINCQIQGIGDGTSTNTMDVAGARSLLLSGAAENTFTHCYIGLDTLAKATAAAEIELKSAATRNVFEDCVIATMSGAAGFLFVKADAASSACDRFTMFKNCTFINAEESTGTTMTAAISTHASLGGMLVLKDCMIVGATDVTASDTSKVRILGSTGAANASGEHKEMLLAKSVDVA